VNHTGDTRIWDERETESTEIEPLPDTEEEEDEACASYWPQGSSDSGSEDEDEEESLEKEEGNHVEQSEQIRYGPAGTMNPRDEGTNQESNDILEPEQTVELTTQMSPEKRVFPTIVGLPRQFKHMFKELMRHTSLRCKTNTTFDCRSKNDGDSQRTDIAFHRASERTWTG
jgi:hypothetical protein